MENSGFTSLDAEALPLPTDQDKIKQWTTWLLGLYQAKNLNASLSCRADSNTLV